MLIGLEIDSSDGIQGKRSIDLTLAAYDIRCCILAMNIT